MRSRALIALALALLTAALFWTAGGHGFLFLDDGDYVYGNKQVAKGLTWEGAIWAFGVNQKANWHPLTWLSHMADVSLFGVTPGPHHLMNVGIHAINVAILFFALTSLTGVLWESAFVAALFAFHPLHVESVAWVAERKDLLSGLFWFLTVWTYGAYVRTPGRWRYSAVLMCFALALMSKPMVVTLPVVLLLLDYWPLGRVMNGSPAASGDPPLRSGWATLIWEKAPLFLMSAVVSTVTLAAQKGVGAVATLTDAPLGVRLANAAISCASYAAKALVPRDLMSFYPYPEFVDYWGAAAALSLLVCVTAAAMAAARSLPPLAVGWLWFLVTLLPVIGLVQVGKQAMANRYTYIPLVGIFVAGTWGVSEAARRWKVPRAVLMALGATALGLAALVSRQEVALWRDDRTLLERDVAAHPELFVSQYELANLLFMTRRYAAAEAHYAAAVRLKPENVLALNNYGLVLMEQGKREKAASAFRQVLQVQPDHAPARRNLLRALGLMR